MARHDTTFRLSDTAIEELRGLIRGTTLSLHTLAKRYGVFPQAVHWHLQQMRHAGERLAHRDRHARKEVSK